jgi:glycosyltransferase involved in cell wall biosynthesis
MTKKRFTCLIPAYNEAARIGAVLQAVLGHPDLAEVIVIDDGSSDGTAERAMAAGARVVRLSPNRGKSGALAAGLDLVQTSHVLLLDADLIGLRAQDIARLIAPVAEGRADVTMSLRGNAPMIWRAMGVDYITGERVQPMSVIRPRLHRLHSLPRFGFEVFVNEILREVPLVVGIIRWPNVASPVKAEKRGFRVGVRQDLGMITDILRTIGVVTALRQMAYLWRITRRSRGLALARGL